ncbi:hypothetical protein E0Z10_g7253 [Xylaria hypoxylon]|uniref:Uncharacterized protein n=1 Tax=Xylaria hypoxylon TaxID=37992 RepID=A0A4Z0YC34_9PEZI|nr:hypothetical protein E0Z10_g7253 [Xylaria hypoxylon]
MSSFGVSRPPADGSDDENDINHSQRVSNPGNNDDNLSDDSEGDDDPDPGAHLMDKSGDVNEEILDELSEDDDENEERRSPPSSRRAPNPKPRRVRCKKCQEIKRQWNKEATELRKEIETTERELNAKIKSLKDEIIRLKAGNTIIWDPWGERLSELLERIRQLDPNGDETDYLYEYHRTYYDSCKQGNMSTNDNITHPDLVLERTVYTPREIRRYFNRQAIRDRYNGALINLRDPDNPPFLDYILGDEVHFPSRFHIGDGPCCVAKADKPSRYLDYLLVCKRWYYVTAHLFYATNTFAFSSLGELGRFFNGIGKPRAERIVNVEFMLRGALTPRQKKGVSLRKQPLACFLYTTRLRTLVVHINESARHYMRRPYEMMKPSDYCTDFGGKKFSTHKEEDKLDIFAMEVRRTDLQPNYRKCRSMRTVQGIDFIYQLRGLKWARFYDTNQPKTCVPIKDHSFLRDINSVVTLKKSDSMALKAEIENLRPLTALKDFVLGDDIKELVLSFYDDTVDLVSDGGSETSSPSSSCISGFSGLAITLSDDSSDSDYSSDSDSDGGSVVSSRRPCGMDRDVEEVYSDTEMGDNGNGPELKPLDVDMSETNSSSGRSSQSGSNNMNRYPDDSGLHTTVTPQPPVIVIEDDDDDDDEINDYNRHMRHDEGFSTNSELFVRSRPRSTPRNGGEGIHVVGNSVDVIDLTGNDDNDIDVTIIDDPNNDEDDGDEDEEVKSYDDDDSEDETNSMKTESSSSQGPSDPPDLGSGSDSNIPLKRSIREGGLG